MLIPQMNSRRAVKDRPQALPSPISPDSLLEQRGFEPLVPLLNEWLSPAKTKRSHFESAIVAGNDRGGASRIEATWSELRGYCP